MAKSSPTTRGQNAQFRFFAAARFPSESGPPPVGAVTFFDGDPLTGSLLGTEYVGPSLTDPEQAVEDALKDNSITFFNTSSLSVGEHDIYAVLFPSSTGPCPGIVHAIHVVNPPPASPSKTIVTTTQNPSVYRQNVTFNATVTRDEGGSAPGTVQFKVDGNDVGAPQDVDADGKASISRDDLAVGGHTITAAYTSSAENTKDSSGDIGQTVDPASTTTDVTTSGSPSEVDQEVTFTATVGASAPGGGTPGGTVQFNEGSTPLGGPQPLDGSGKASVKTSTLDLGDHTISATYTPANGNYRESSDSVSQTVERAQTTLVYDGPVTGDFHDPVTVSATLTRSRTGTPVEGRSVTVSLGAVSCDGTTGAAGKASCVLTPNNPSGSYTVASSFAGDARFGDSRDADAFTITREQTTLDLSTSPTVEAGGPAALEADLTEDDGAPAIAGRSVTFTLGSGDTAQSCTGRTDDQGRAGCRIPVVDQPLGPSRATATFAQDEYYLASSDSADVLLFAFPARGGFLLGDQTATGDVKYSGALWPLRNSVSRGQALPGLAGRVYPTQKRPTCGGDFKATVERPRLSRDIPTYMGTLVTDRITRGRRQNSFAGVITKIVVVETAFRRGRPTGDATVLAEVCGSEE